MYESFTTPQLEETFHTHSSTGLSSTEADERLRQSGEKHTSKKKGKRPKTNFWGTNWINWQIGKPSLTEQPNAPIEF